MDICIHPRSMQEAVKRLACGPAHLRGMNKPFAVSVTVVVPAMNEAGNLPHVFASLPRWVDEIILVDGHRPTTRSRWPAACARHPHRARSRHAARATPWPAASPPPRGDIIVMIDADGSTDPAEIPAFVERARSPAPTSPRAPGSPPAAAPTTSPCCRALGNKVPQRPRQPAVRHPLHRPVLRLQRVLGAAALRRTLAALGPGDGFEIETLINVRIAHAGLARHRGAQPRALRASTARAT